MTQREDLTGQKFGRLTVISYHEYSRWNCVCECGVEKIVFAQQLKNGKTKSCGCFRKEATGNFSRSHGKSKTKTYDIWRSMKSRCYIPSATGYENWGGRGITVCDRWKDNYENFLEDMGECPEGMSLDRINVDGNYEPTNCQWVPKADQMRNQQKTIWYKGKAIWQWEKETGIKAATLRARLRKFGTLFPEHL